MILLEIHRVFTKSDEKTHVRFPFTVPEGVTGLRLELSFSPAHDNGAGGAEVEETFRRDAPYLAFTAEDVNRELPLRNFLDVSLDSPSGWVGTTHRHGSVKHLEISEKSASYGFHPVKTEPGEWTLTLSFNAVVTPELFVNVAVEGAK